MQGEGVAYRGRIMVAAEMSLDSLPTASIEDIKRAEVNRLTPLLRRRNYKLFGAFFSATMVVPSDQPSEFEVSIGDYGNRLDRNSPVQSSSTHPMNPVFDGIRYYYLPWLDEKPFIQVSL